MNYTELCLRGYTYTLTAANNWDKRRDKIMTASFVKYGNNPPEDKRYFKIFHQLSRRIEVIGRILDQIKEKEKKQNIEAGMQYMKLQCFKIQCRYNPIGQGVLVRLMDYKPGVHKCNICGSELKTQEDYDLDYELMKICVRIL